MSYDGPTPTKLGRVQSVPPMQLYRLHVAVPPETLKEVSWTVPIPVLDQEDLFKQGIDTSALVPGAQKVDALGSCTANAGTGHLAERWTAAGRDLAAVKVDEAVSPVLGYAAGVTSLSPTSAKADEEFAIFLYHMVTIQTGDPATEYPPTDCGSSGYHVCTELEKQGIATSYKTGSGVLGALSLLQAGTVMQGLPWFNAWFTPDAQGFVDGDGSADALEAAIESGVAGGHETLQTGIPQLAVTSTGQVDLQSTVIEIRNSWSASWGLAGSYRIHASTLDYLAAYADFKAIVVSAA
jgi:hypothetical protein